jgi:hypothetical protein
MVSYSSARGMWVPAATSYCGRCLRPMLPETRKWAIFICIWEPPGMRRPDVPYRVAGLGGLVTESYPVALNRRLVV